MCVFVDAFVWIDYDLLCDDVWFGLFVVVCLCWCVGVCLDN